MTTVSNKMSKNEYISGVYVHEGVRYYYRGKYSDTSIVGTEIVSEGEVSKKTILIPIGEIYALHR